MGILPARDRLPSLLRTAALTRLKPAAVLALLVLTWTGCSGEPESVIRVSHVEKAPPARAKRHPHPLNVYAATMPGRGVRASVAHAKPRVYVPEAGGNAVDVIDPHTFKLI